jgi:hypothetical protein
MTTFVRWRKAQSAFPLVLITCLSALRTAWIAAREPDRHRFQISARRARGGRPRRLLSKPNTSLLLTVLSAARCPPVVSTVPQASGAPSS